MYFFILPSIITPRLLSFIASFAFVLQRCSQRGLRAKPIPLWLRTSKGSPCGRAPAIAGERGVVATIYPLRRLRRHRLAAARSRSGSDTTPWCHSFPSRRFATQRERLFVSPIITQIGRKSKSDIIAIAIVILKPCGFSDILFAKNSRSEYHSA